MELSNGFLNLEMKTFRNYNFKDSLSIPKELIEEVNEEIHEVIKVFL